MAYIPILFQFHYSELVTTTIQDGWKATQTRLKEGVTADYISQEAGHRKLKKKERIKERSTREREREKCFI